VSIANLLYLKMMKANAALLIAAIALANATEFYDIGSWRRPLFATLLLISIVVSSRTKSWASLGCTLLLFSLHFYGLVVPHWFHAIPVFGFLLPFLFTSAILLTFSPTRDYFPWFSRGKIDRASKVLIVLTSVLSVGALILWAFWTNNLGYGAVFVKAFGPTPRWQIFTVFIPAFALANAFAEEVVFRGLIQESLSRVFRNTYLVLILQASAFAAAHFSGGFPNGYVGCVFRPCRRGIPESCRRHESV
jgi:membrane protease YdiL (CAAX protease family)